MVKAARLVQAAYRGRLGKKTLAQLVLTRRKEQLKKEYLLERKAKEARERCNRLLAERRRGGEQLCASGGRIRY